MTTQVANPPVQSIRLLFSALLLVMLLAGVPISVALAVSSICAILPVLDVGRGVLTGAQRIFSGISVFSLLAIPFFYLWKFKTGLLKPAMIGTLRMIIQLFFIGVYLKYLFLWNNPWINFLWVIIMIFVAGQTALVRTQLKRGILLIPISIGFLCSVVVVGLYFIGVVLQLDNIFSAQYFIPIFGILMGNMLSSNVIALNTYYSGLKREQQLYRYLLGNGATRQEAQAPFIKQAIIKSFSPLIANIAVMGLVALPGTMIGQILGGSSPNVAIKYQMMIMVITFTASMLSLMITISLASRRSFDAYGKLLEVTKETKK